MRALDRKLIRDLVRIKGQALSIACVIGGGIATLVMALATVDSLQETRGAFYERYRFGDVFAQAKRAPRWMEREISQLPGVIRAEGRIVQDIIIDAAGMQEPARGRVISRRTGTDGRLNDVVIRRGRDLRAGHPDEVLVNESFAEAHDLELGDTLGGNINERPRTLRVVGIVLSPEFVYALGPGDIVPDDRHFGVLWMSEETLEAAYDLKGAFNDITLRLTRDASRSDVIDRVDQLLGRYGGVGAFDRADHPSNAFVDSELDQLAHLASVIPPIFLVVAAFLFNVVIARFVQTEREQIGVLKAFGYSNAEVGWLYLKLVLAITALGILIGWGAGAWMAIEMTRLFGEYYRFPFLSLVVDPATFIFGAGAGIVAAVSGSLVSVRRAVAIAPAVAMAPPVPHTYRATLAERLGLLRGFSQPARMVLRHIVRWPLRAALTVVGISFSVAILIISLFFMDGVNEMMEIHFFDTKRQDMSLTFVDTRSNEIRTNVDDLPGVLAVETYRTVPAKLRVNHREERVAIEGIDAGARLSPLVDSKRRVVPVPPEGIVLSDKLAELLGAREGDMVTVAALEGRRPIRRIPVVRVVRQYIGFAAYMDRRALNRLMGEGDVVSGAHVVTDRRAEPALYAALKLTPALHGLNVRHAAFETFRAIIEKNLGTMLFFYVAFAALIASGVMYNSARISLSERARELASLRVLGYTQREVGSILAGELAILTLIALPLGCLVGYGMSALMVTLFDTKLYRIPFVIEPSTYGASVLFVLATAIASAWVVLRRVAALDLIAVLKTRE